MRKCKEKFYRIVLMMSTAATLAFIVIFFILSKWKQDGGEYTKDLLTPKLTSIEGIKRQRRFIIFNGSGVVKLVLGVSFPIMLDKKRSLNVFYNLQMQYTPAPRPLYWWSFYNTTAFAARKQRFADFLSRNDNSRSSVYQFIETAMQRTGIFGSDCLLKVICEIARAPLTEDVGKLHKSKDTRNEHATQNIYHELINAIFTPNLPNVHQRYLDASAAGSNEANCNELFAQCSAVDKWFRSFTRFM